MQSKTRPRKANRWTLGRLSGLLLLAGLLGCGTEIILEQPGTIVKNYKALKGVEVLVPDGKGNIVPGIATIPAGAMIRVPLEGITTAR